MAFSTVKKDDDNGHKQGERFLVIFHNDGTMSSAFLYDDGNFVTKIELFDSNPEFECDVRELNALADVEP